MAIQGILFEVDLLCLGEDRPNLRLELLLSHHHPLVDHRLVFGGIGPDLGPVEGHAAQLDESHPFRDLQPLDDQALKHVEIPLAEAGDRVVVGVLVGGEVAKGDILEGGALDLYVFSLPDELTGG